MMTLSQKLVTLVATTAIIWISVMAAVLINAHVFANAVALIIGIIATLTLWSLWALDQIGISVDGTPREVHTIPHEKPKRDADAGEDARLALLLSMLTPNEREALKSRLVDELDGDGEMVSLADLLAEQEQDTQSTEHA